MAMTTPPTDLAKYLHVAALKKSSSINDPILAEDHMKALVVALQLEGFTKGTSVCEPRSDPPYAKYTARPYDPTRDGLSPEEMAFLTTEQKESALMQNVMKYASERRRLETDAELEIKKIYYLVRSTYSIASIAKARQLDIKAFDAGEITQDTQGLVRAYVVSHSGATGTGLSAFAIQDLLDKRVKLYFACVKGNRSMESYLEETLKHLAAIKSMDSNVSADGTGGYLGSQDDIVMRFLRGSGATRVINLHLNGMLNADKIPRNLEDVCSLLSTWEGPLTEEQVSPYAKPSASIMAWHAEEETILATTSLATTSQPRRGPGSAVQTIASAAEVAAKRAISNAEALTTGTIMVPRSQWKGNEGCPNPPLIRTAKPTIERDRVCENSNCLGYHPNRGRKTSWVSCPCYWDPTCVKRNDQYKARMAATGGTERHRSRSGAKTGDSPQFAGAQQPPPAATIGHTSAQDRYSAGEHAAAMSYRHAAVAAALSRSEDRQMNIHHGQYQAVETSTDEQGWTLPWDGAGYHHSYTISVVAGPATQPAHRFAPRPSAITRRFLTKWLSDPSGYEALVQLNQVFKNEAGLPATGDFVSIRLFLDSKSIAGRRAAGDYAGTVQAVRELLELYPEVAESLGGVLIRRYLTDEVVLRDICATRHASAASTEPEPADQYINLAQSNAKTGGVPGVTYQAIPWNSGYRDPGHIAGDEIAWTFDSGAGAAGFRDRHGLSALGRLSRPVVIGGIVSGNNVTVTMGGMLENVKVLVSEDFSANCLPSSTILDAGWKLQYHPPTDMYVVRTPGGSLLHFQRFVKEDLNITGHYLCHPRMAYSGPDYVLSERPDQVVLATSVQGNMSMHTPQDVKAATIAQRLATNMGGSAAHAAARLPLVKGINVTADHVRKATQIFGPIRSHVQGSSTMVQDTAIVMELPASRPAPVPQSLAIDLCKILGAWFVLGIFLPCHFTTVVNVQDHAATSILTAVKTMVKGARKRNFDVMKIQADGEKGIHCGLMDEYCSEARIKLQATGAGQHEVHVERATRNIKADVRDMAARLIPSSLPRPLVVGMVQAAATRINCRLTTALVGTLSPMQVWTGDEQQHVEDLDFTFGDLAMARTPNNTNDVAPRADTVMVLYPVFNDLHGYLVYKLGTGMTLVRNFNTLKHTPWSTADKLHIEALGKDDPDGVTLPRREPGTDVGGSATPPQPDESQPETTTVSRVQHDAMADLAPEEAWVTDHPTVGTPIAGVFKGKLYGGKIDKVLLAHIDHVGDEIPNTYHASYLDGDSQDLEGEEALQHAMDLVHLLPASSAARLGVQRRAMRQPVPVPPPVSRLGMQTRAQSVDHQIHRLSVAQAMRERPVETDAAVRAELNQMLTLGVFTPVHTSDLSHEQRSRVIRSSIFMKLKMSPSGVFIKSKARLVAGGDRQDKSLYTNLSSPTATPASVLFVCGDAALKGKSVASMDIGAAYLNASMEGTGVQVNMVIEARCAKILAELDPKYNQYLRPDGTVCVRLLKALYGTVEAARLWHDLITKVLVDNGFIANVHEKCVLNKRLADGTMVTVVLYVDDLLVTCDRAEGIAALRAYLESKFPEVAFHTGDVIEYVGMTVDFISKPGAAVVTMKQMTDDIIDTGKVLTKYPTPAADNLFIVPVSPRLASDGESRFRTIVAKLLYLAKRARPDVLLPVSWLTTRVRECTVDDMAKLDRVIGYLMGTPDRGIVIEFGTDPTAKAYIDASYAIHKRDCKSHTGASIIFGKGGPIYVTSVKQPITAKSSTEAELIAFSDVSSELISARNFAIAQGYPPTAAVAYQDNESTMKLVDNGGPCSKRTKHIEIRHFWMSEQIAKGVITVEHCPTQVMWANLLTKPLQGQQFVSERKGLTNW